MKRCIFIFAFFSFLSVSLFAQKPHIQFNVTSHNFGEIKEVNGLVSFTFDFVNTGKSPLIINEAKPSCGCTASDYTKSPVMPGGKGYIKATYDPKDSPGRFEKSISVISNADNSPFELKFSGVVIGRDKNNNDFYPRIVGELRFRSEVLPFAKVKKTKIVRDSFLIYNPTQKTVKIELTDVPVHLTILTHPSQLGAGKTGYITVIYNAAKKTTNGFQKDFMKLKLNGKVVDTPKLEVNANVVE